MILDWSHSYQDNNICQQATPNNNKPEEFFKSLSSSQSSVNKHCRSQSIWTCYCFLHISVFLIIQCVFSVCLHVGSWVGRFMHAYMHGCADVWVSKGWVGVGGWGGGGCMESYTRAGAWGHSLLTLRIIMRTDKTMTARNSIFVRVLISRSTVPILNMKNKQSFCRVLISYTLILTSNALNNDNCSVPKKKQTLLVFFRQCFNFLV